MPSINWLKIAAGAYLMLPGVEDVAAGGTTLLPSAAVGLGLILNGLGVLE